MSNSFNSSSGGGNKENKKIRIPGNYGNPQEDKRISLKSLPHFLFGHMKFRVPILKKFIINEHTVKIPVG